MAPTKVQAAPYAKDEKVLCFHHEMLYEAKVLDTRPTDDNQSWQYKIHYKGWKNTWDDWVPQDRVRKFTEENKELASQLHAQMKALQQKPAASSTKTKKATRANGSDLGSARGSEERHTSVAAHGRRRQRDYDLEQRSWCAAGPEKTLTSPFASRTSHLSTIHVTGTERVLLLNLHFVVFPHKATIFHYKHSLDFCISTAMTSLHDTLPDLQVRGNEVKACLSRSTSSSPLSVLSRSPSPPGECYVPQIPRCDAVAKDTHAQIHKQSIMTSETSHHQDRLPNGQFKKRQISRISSDSATSPGQVENTSRNMVAFLQSKKSVAKDPLLRLPPPGYSYIDAGGNLKEPNKYDMDKQQSSPHPRLLAHIRNGTATNSLHQYYQDMDPDHRLPIAGIIQEDHPNATRPKNTLTNTLTFQEEGFHARPSIKLPMPDHLKAILVDDWENVTKNQQLVPLPAKHPVHSILADYIAVEKPKRQPASADEDILEEVVAGLKEYFEKCLGRILLYRFERYQYLEMRELWTSGKDEWAEKTAGDTYGAEHLCRLLVSLPELIAQTNMDLQSVNRLREELTKMTNWLGKNAIKYFVSDYETPNQTYIEKARGF